MTSDAIFALIDGISRAFHRRFMRAIGRWVPEEGRRQPALELALVQIGAQLGCPAGDREAWSGWFGRQQDPRPARHGYAPPDYYLSNGPQAVHTLTGRLSFRLPDAVDGPARPKYGRKVTDG